jgi:phenylacetate-coenzyme A ligase PaaK-like adenylate-forming protein
MGILNILGVARDLLKTNKADASYAVKIQDQRLRAILRHATENSEFFRSLYKGFDIETCRLSNLPVISKAQMMENFDRFVIDNRLKYREVRDWLKKNRGTGKLYLNEFIPVLTSGTTTETALVIYSRSAIK